MNGLVMGLFAETAVHPGAGQTDGAIDLPVAREATTGYPVIPGSSLKGALRSRVEAEWDPKETGEEGAKPSVEIFGSHEGAGAVLVTDARVALLPVRSLQRPFLWVTCPYILERLARDLKLVGFSQSEWPAVTVEEETARAVLEDSVIFLEELSFEVKKDVDLISRVSALFAPLIRHKTVRDRLSKQLVVISDAEFAHFAAHGLPVNARNVLDENKRSQNLWYEEVVPPETLFYALLLPRGDDRTVLEKLKELFADRPYLQVGGNETVGQGWCAVTVWDPAKQTV